MRAAPSGVQSGALIAAASLLATGLNYVFLLAAGRILGSDDYGDLAALLGLLTVVLLPTGAVQLAVSREVSRRLAVGDSEGADAFARSSLRLGLIATLPAVLLGLILVVPLRELLNIESTAPVALAMSGLSVALALPISVGVLQGRERFRAIALLYVLPFALRLALLVVLAAVGYRLGGAVFAAVAGGFASAAIALALLREPLRRGVRAARPALGPFLRYLWPVVVGLIGIAVLTNVDLLVVNARFSEDAGAYAAASAFARVAFFLPATILTVLFPRTAARQARGEEAGDILGRSLIVTAVFGVGLAVFYGLTGRGIVHTSFGGEFAEGGELLFPFTISLTLFALANVLVGFHLSRGETRFAWIVAGAVPVQIAVLALVPSSTREVIWANLALGIALLAAHELVMGSSLTSLRTGLGLLVGGVRVARAALVEAGLVLAGYTAFVCVLFWPVVSGLSSAFVAPGSDPVGGVWWFWRLEEEGGYHLFGSTHHTTTGAPFGWEEGNGLNLQWLVPYYPTYLAAKVVGEVAAFNLLLLSGYVLSAASMYLLVRYLGAGRLVSAWAGAVYILFPWHLERTPHPSLVHLELLPLLLLALVAAARRPTWSRFALVGAAAFGCWLTSGYYGTMAVIGSLVFGLGAMLVIGWRRGAVLAGGATGAAIGASAVVATLAVMSGVGTNVGLDRVASDLSVYGLRPLELVVPAQDNVVADGRLDDFWLDRRHDSNQTETSNYLGLLTIALALTWLVVAWRRRATLSVALRVATVGLTSLVAVALLLALPSPISVFGAEVWAPSRLLWELTPAFRVPSRWVPLAMTALVPLAALGLQVVVGRIGAVYRPRFVAAGVVTVAMLVSLLELTVSPAEPLFRTDVPAEYEALAGTPEGIVADYPLVQDIDRVFWQTKYERPVLNSDAIGTSADEARRVLVDPSAPGTAEALAFLGVTATVTHPDALAYVAGVPDVPNASWGPGYELVARTPKGSSVWQVVAPAAPALATLPGAFTGPVPVSGGEPGYPFVAPSGVGTIELVAKAPSVVRLTFAAEPPPGGPRVLRLGDSATERSFTLEGRTEVSILVEVPAGRSYVLVKTDPAAESDEDAIVISAPRAVTVAESPELRAELISADPGL